MNIICKYNKISKINNINRQKILRNYNSEDEQWINIDQEYTVYGIVFWDNNPFYYIREEEYENYPKPHAADFFEITDQRFSSYWRLFYEVWEDGSVIPELVFPEWKNDPSYYEKLLDGDLEAEEIFKKYAHLMDIEFND